MTMTWRNQILVEILTTLRLILSQKITLNLPLFCTLMTTLNFNMIMNNNKNSQLATMQQHQQQQQQQQTFQQQPPAKKLKLEDTHMSSLSQHTGKAVVPSNVSTAGSGITGRLGLNVFGGQISLPQKPPQSQLSAHGNVQLPIGVGIRVGGVTPQSSTAAAGGVPLNHMQWNSSGNKTNAQFGTWAGLSGSAPGAQQGISEQAMAERRQRNREHAKRSRVRKKFLLESLQADVSQLQSDNNGLRMLIQSKIPQHAQQIIDTCCMKSPLFGDDGQTGEDGKSKSDTELSKSDYTLIGNLTSGQQNFVLSDPRLPDNPIVFASEGFYQLTGYTREQVLGRNCRFLQGPGTDPKAVDVIRTAVANGTDASTCILNYKADGTPFWNQFFVAALRDSDNCIVNYVGVQCVVDPDAGASALEDKVDSVLPLQEKGKGEEK
mmetsp:Transcript_21285/g.24195  ORF Transcript_21285/g.24195 Transcript_21285/m.24195 type:complete len:434 (-) Transcript_21285:4-1305(-)